MKQAAHQALIQDISPTAEYPEDWTEEDKQNFEEKIRATAKQVNDENNLNPDADDKNIFYDKETGTIYEVDEKTEEVIRKYSYENGEFKTVDYIKLKQQTFDIIDSIFLPGFMVITQGNLGQGVIPLDLSFMQPGFMALKSAIDIVKSDWFQRWDTLGGTRTEWGKTRTDTILLNLTASYIASNTLKASGTVIKASPYYGSYLALASAFTISDGAMAIAGSLLGSEDLMDYSVVNNLFGSKWGPALKAGTTMANIAGSVGETWRVFKSIPISYTDVKTVILIISKTLYSTLYK